MAYASPIPTLALRRGALDFFIGLSLPFRGFGLIFRSGKLLGLTAISAVVTFVSLVALVTLLVLYTDDVLSALWAKPAEGWLALTGWYVALVLTFLVLLVTGANTVPLALQAPLQDPMSEATEELCGGVTRAGASAGFARGLFVSLAYTFGRIAVLLVGHAALLLLNIIPGLGSVLWSLAASAWTILWAAVEYLAAPMARHLYPFSAVRRAVRTRLAAAFGFGCGVYIVLWIPVLNLFFIPMAIIGGTLFFRGLRDAGVLGPPPAPAR